MIKVPILVLPMEIGRRSAEPPSVTFGNVGAWLELNRETLQEMATSAPRAKAACGDYDVLFVRGARIRTEHGTGLRGSRGVGLPVAFGGLDDQAHANGFRGNLDAADPSIDECADALDVRLKLTFGDAGRLAPDAAEVLRLTLPRDRPPGAGLLPRKITYACHATPRSNHRDSRVERRSVRTRRDREV